MGTNRKQFLVFARSLVHYQEPVYQQLKAPTFLEPIAVDDAAIILWFCACFWPTATCWSDFQILEMFYGNDMK